jgi:hypothetical protein
MEKSKQRKKTQYKSQETFMLKLGIGIFLFILVVVCIIEFLWKSVENLYSCNVEKRQVTCVDETRQSIEPEAIFSDKQKNSFYQGNGITISFAGDADPELLKPLQVQKASNINFDQPKHREAVNNLATNFTARIATLRNPEAKIETLVVVSDFTAGIDERYRLKLANRLKDILINNLQQDNFTDVRMFASTDKTIVNPINMPQIISSQVGVEQFVADLPKQMPNSKDLPSSPLVESIWTILNNFTETSDLTVLFYTDLEQNTASFKLTAQKDRKAMSNHEDLKNIVEEITKEIKSCPQISKIKRFEFLALPTAEQKSYADLQPFWLSILAKNGIPSEKVEFKY